MKERFQSRPTIALASLPHATTMPPFLILSLPRSRSAWLRHWLSGSQKKVGHDTLITANSVADWLESFGDGRLEGSCETAGMLGWELWKKRWADSPMVVVKRPVWAVSSSLTAAGFPFSPSELTHRAALLDEAARSADMVLEFDDLRKPSVCKELWQLVVGSSWRQEWWEVWDALNVQVRSDERMKLLAGRQAQIAELKKEAAQMRVVA